MRGVPAGPAAPADAPEGGRRVRELPGCAGAIPAVLLEGLGPGIRAGITTFERNFRFRARAADAAVAAAYVELDAFAAPFGGWARVEQVHGPRVVEVRAEAASGAGLGEADGLVIREDAARPRLLTATVADCVPVFLAWERGYGLLHAGWRGTAAGVLEAGVAAAGVAPRELRVHLGPAIAGCCYEVGPEVVEALYAGSGGVEAALARAVARPGRGDRLMLDLRRALAARAAALGVSSRNVSISASCTACDPRFHSLRGSGGGAVTRLMLAFAGREAGGV